MRKNQSITFIWMDAEMNNMKEGLSGYFPEEPDERVRYAMARVNRFLFREKKANRFPYKSPGHTLNLHGWDEIEIKYIVTALMVFGQRYPEMNLNSQTLNCSGGGYLIKQHELKSGFWSYFSKSPFSKNSLYETEFKHHLTEDMFELKECPVAFVKFFGQEPMAIEEQEEAIKREEEAQKEREKEEKDYPSYEAPTSYSLYDTWDVSLKKFIARLLMENQSILRTKTMITLFAATFCRLSPKGW